MKNTDSNKAGYTPGPWKARHTPDRGIDDIWCIDWSDDQEEVAEIVHSEANARLIAAAPALVEALEDLCAQLGECGMTERARAALRAAGVEL